MGLTGKVLPCPWVYQGLGGGGTLGSELLPREPPSGFRDPAPPGLSLLPHAESRALLWTRSWAFDLGLCTCCPASVHMPKPVSPRMKTCKDEGRPIPIPIEASLGLNWFHPRASELECCLWGKTSMTFTRPLGERPMKAILCDTEA